MTNYGLSEVPKVVKIERNSAGKSNNVILHSSRMCIRSVRLSNPVTTIKHLNLTGEAGDVRQICQKSCSTREGSAGMYK